MDGTMLVRLKFVIQMVIQTVKYVEGKMQLYIYGAALASALHLEVIIYQNIHSLYDYLFYRGNMELLLIHKFGTRGLSKHFYA
jgi:hypothetical protein